MTETFTERQRRELAGRARTLHERLDGPSNATGTEPPIDPDDVVEAFEEKYPDEEAFRDRLRKEGLTVADVRQQVAATEWPADEPLPEWVEELEALAAWLEATAPGDPTVDADDETPFVELLAAIVEYARDRLPADQVPVDALAAMEDWLVDRLERLCTRPLYVEFKSFVEYHDPELAETDPDAVADPPTEYYDRFVDAMLEHGFRNLCLEYPVLARQLVGLIDQWVEAVVEVSRRARADRSALRERFDVDGAITALEPLADDVHANGRSPVRVSFESGEAIYKPRGVGGGRAFYAILDRLEEHVSVPSFEKPAYLVRDGYGWMQSVDHRELPDADGADRYYERAGALLCVAYVLNFIDCQFENLISAGEHPIVVDGETVFHPHNEADATPGRTGVGTFVDRTVLLTALVPSYVELPDGDDDEEYMSATAGFGSSREKTELSNRPMPVAEAVNTDVMAIEARPPTIRPEVNAPVLDDEVRPPGDHVDAMVRGFEETHETIRELRDDGRFCTEIADPELLDGVETRLLYRHTAQYKSILRGAAARDPLRDGVRLSAEFETLATSFYDGSVEADRCWPLYEAERRALRRRDVPRIGARPDRRELFHDGQVLDVSVDETGYRRVQRRLDAMDDADEIRQTWLIRTVFGPEPEETTLPDPVEVTDERLGSAAVELFDDGVDAAVETVDRRRWMQVAPSSTITLLPEEYSVYHGRTGIAITAAALHRAMGRSRYRRLAAEALEPVLEDLADDDLRIELGGTRGLGSLVYGLTVVGELLGDDGYRERALEATRLVTGDRIADDDSYDVMSGTAGTLLGLLAYHDRHGGADVLDRAISCGDRLLDARVTRDGRGVWVTTDDGDVPPGFAHGTTGIAYALARLAASTGDRRYADATREALAFESSRLGIGSDDREGELGEWASRGQWCHGPAGMALGRFGIGERLGDRSAFDEASAVLSATEPPRRPRSDTACCGNVALVEARLVEAHRGDGEVADAARLAGRSLARRDRDGSLSLLGHSGPVTNPTFFDGVSGVAYTLLRLRSPETFPCVLLLE